MNKIFKCDNCNHEIGYDDSVFISIIRYDHRGRTTKHRMMCCKCYDSLLISDPDEEENDPLRNEKLRIHYTPNKEAYNND